VARLTSQDEFVAAFAPICDPTHRLALTVVAHCVVAPRAAMSSYRSSRELADGGVIVFPGPMTAPLNDGKSVAN
jgi:hypothetical protein